MALRYGTRSRGISQFYLHTPGLSANEMNHTCLCLPSRSILNMHDNHFLNLECSLLKDSITIFFYSVAEFNHERSIPISIFSFTKSQKTV